ncbi:MAG: ribosome maturation factor RimP [Acidobacteria bacterium]|nr:MAG: ribosome maturation factor RimP [Acidobacteriota bacterium]
MPFGPRPSEAARGRLFSCVFGPRGGARRHGGRDGATLSTRHDIEQEIRAIADRAAADQGVEIYDLVYRRLGPRWKLQVFLWRDDRPVSLDDCERVSRQISRELDIEDPIPHGYDLEVSSPGLERPLRTPAHWTRTVGEKVRVRYRDAEGRARTEIATLAAVDEARGTVTLRSASDSEQQLSLDSVLSARVHVEW